MRYLITAFVLYAFSTIPAMADAPPAILGAVDTANIQAIDNNENIRGEYFRVYLNDPNRSVRAAEEFCSKRFAHCTGRYASVLAGLGGAGFLGVQHKVGTFSNGVFKIVNQWKKY